MCNYITEKPEMKLGAAKSCKFIEVCELVLLGKAGLQSEEGCNSILQVQEQGCSPAWP